MKSKSLEPIRCRWARNPLSIRYHDEEWGVPQHDDRRLFEFLILEGAQAGLSWDTILKKRENYRAAFDQFDPNRIAVYDTWKSKQRRFDQLCEEVSLSLTASGLRSRELIATLPEARNRVYTRRYGRLVSGHDPHRRARSRR